MGAMDTSTTQRANDRTRAMLRLRNLTIGTALVGAAATSGLGWLAANTDAGSTATVTSVGSSTTTTTTSGSSSATSTATPAPTTSTSSTTGVSGSTGKAQVSTGGS